MSWLDRRFHLDQFPGPQQSPSRPSREIDQPLRLLTQQIRSTFLSNRNHSSTIISAPLHDISSTSSTIANPTQQPDPQLDEPPPAYHTLFPQAPVSVDLDFEPIPQAHQLSSPRESLQSDCEAWDLSPFRSPKRQPRHAERRPTEQGRTRGRPRRTHLTAERVNAFEHYNLGVDPSMYKTTRIDTHGASHFFLLTPRPARRITHRAQSPSRQVQSPSSAARTRPRARTPSPPVLSVPDYDIVDFTAPNLHQIHQAHVPVVSLPSMSDTEQTRVVRILRDSGGLYSIVADPNNS